MVRTSSRPSSIPKHSSHLAVSVRLAKLPAGPIVSPRPGPTLAMAVAAAVMDVIKSRPVAAKAMLSRTLHSTNRNRKPMTAWTISGFRGRPW